MGRYEATIDRLDFKSLAEEIAFVRIEITHPAGIVSLPHSQESISTNAGR